MATKLYRPDQLGIKSPTGGFQLGGWYEGRQYWEKDGQGWVTDPGVINPLSNQQGAGQKVSSEVNRQSSIAQGKAPGAIDQYVQQQQQVQDQSVVQPAMTMADQSGGGMGLSGVGMTAANQGVPNLEGIYQGLMTDSGIIEGQQRLTDAETKFLEARNEIGNNPFASASAIDNRTRRLRQIYEKETQPIRDEIAMKQADVETQMNLQLKQFDINSQVAQQSLQQFGMLLESGALNSATGQDIANLTRQTGISSSMIQSAVTAAKAKNAPKPQMVSFDDGKNQGFVLVNPETGQVINKQVLASSKPSASSGGASPGSSQYNTVLKGSINSAINSSVNEGGFLDPQSWNDALAEYMAKGLGNRGDFIKEYAWYADPKQKDFQSSYGFSPTLREEITGEY